MRRRSSLLALACAVAAGTLAGCSRQPSSEAAQAPPPAQPVDVQADQKGEPAESAASSLTIYSGDYAALVDGGPGYAGMPGYALVSRPLHYALQAGRNTISATRVPRSMDVEAALLRPRAPGVTVLSQRYVGALSGTGEVVAQIIGQRIAVEHTSGGAKQTDTGILLAADNGLTLALGDGRIKVIREYDSFSIVDAADLLPQEPTLRWTVAAKSAGDAGFVLSYPMAGLAWRAEYRATLVADGAAANAAGSRTDTSKAAAPDAAASNRAAPDAATANSDDRDAGCRLTLTGAALIANHSDVGFSNAKVTLVAGNPNLVQGGGSGRKMAYARAADVAAAAPPMPVERRSGEYHAYQLPGVTSISRGAIERVPLFPRQPAVACQRTYVVDADMPSWQPPQPLIAPDQRGQTGELPVVATVSLHNTKQGGLGLPLPAGRVRVFEGNDLLGESQLPHTPAGAEIRLQLGEAFDLTAKRQSTAFSLDRSGRTLTESFAITLGNAKPSDVTVRVVEPLPRWSDWEIIASSVPVAKKDARHVEFDVPVPAGGETRLTYTVRYRWAEGVRP